MKVKHFLCFIILFCGLFISLNAQVRYVHNIPIIMPNPNFFQYKYTPKQIFPCPDGGIMVLGDCTAQYSIDPNLYAADCGVIKLDAAGNCEWQWWSRNFIGNDSPNIIAIDQEADGRVNFLINTPPEQSWIGWITPNENYSLQDIQLPNCEINRALRLPNNDIIAIGRIYDYNSPPIYGVHALFMRLDAQGDTLSIRHYAPDTLWIYTGPWNRWAHAYDMEFDTDGMPVSTCQFTDRFASVVKTDWDGNLIWRRDTNSPIIETTLAITKIPLSNDIVFGYRPGSGFTCFDYNVYKVTAAGIDSLFTIINNQCVRGYYYSIIGKDNKIILAGNFQFDNSNYSILVSSYNMMGQSNWIWSFDMDYFLGGICTDCVIILPDSNIVHVTAGQLWGDYGLYVVKLHPDGTANEDELLTKPTKRIFTYPNPMKELLNIEMKDVQKNQWKPLIVQIFNIKGQLVRAINLDRKSDSEYSAIWDGTDVNGKSCANGTYILKLQNNNDTTSSKIVLIK